MNDPRLTGAPIVRRTACHIGTHAFIGTTLGDNTACDCGAYTLGEWQRVLAALGQEEGG